jgi:integrase
MPKWRDWPLGRIDYMAVQEWVTELGGSIAGTTVAKCYGVLSMVLRSALRARLIPVDPSEGVHVQGGSKTRRAAWALTRTEVFELLVPAVPERYRTLVLLCASTGLRWGECTGLTWQALDLTDGWLRVSQVAVETAETVAMKPYPKSRAGRRVVPVPKAALQALRELNGRLGQPDGRQLVFVDREGGPLRRSNFRRRVWLPSLVRAGLLGGFEHTAAGKWQAAWCDREGVEWTQEFATEREAVAHVASHAVGGPRFHDLRHSYATWLVSDGVPVNVVQHALGHEQASTTLNLYTHQSGEYESRLRTSMDAGAADLLLTVTASEGLVDEGKDAQDNDSPGTTRDEEDPGTGTTPVGG